jgi:hypothetical protein
MSLLYWTWHRLLLPWHPVILHHGKYNTATVFCGSPTLCWTNPKYLFHQTANDNDMTMGEGMSFTIGLSHFLCTSVCIDANFSECVCVNVAKYPNWHFTFFVWQKYLETICGQCCYNLFGLGLFDSWNQIDFNQRSTLFVMIDIIIRLSCVNVVRTARFAEYRTSTGLIMSWWDVIDAVFGFITFSDLLIISNDINLQLYIVSDLFCTRSC